MEEEKTQTTKTEEVKVPEMLGKLINAGVHIGRNKSTGHPKMKPFIFTTRQDVQVMNVEKIEEKLREAAEFLKSIASKGGIILFVSVSMPAKNAVKKAAEELKMPYVFDRWLGGTLTNFGIISKRINYFLKQEDKKAKGEFSKYTKKEQLDFNEEIKNLERKIGGIKTLKKLPDAVFLVDSQEHNIVIKEAKKVGVPIVAVSSTHTDPTLVDYPIPANDRSIKSIEFIMDFLKNEILQGLKKAESVKPISDNKNKK
jgi:small subunit ribosomal protein S2